MKTKPDVEDLTYKLFILFGLGITFFVTGIIDMIQTPDYIAMIFITAGVILLIIGLYVLFKDLPQARKRK